MKWVNEGHCNFINTAFSGAAKRGNFQILKYLSEYGFTGFEYFVCLGAALGGHVQLIAWAIPRTYSLAKLEEILVTRGRVDIVAELESLVDDSNWGNHTKRGAAIFAGSLELLEGKSGDKNFAEFFSGLVAEAGRVDILDAMEKYWVQWKARSFLRKASARGHLELVQRALALECPYHDYQLIQNAAQSGNLELIVWLMDEKNCIWDITTASSAAFYGRLEV
jgi:hypothetical protein